MKGLLLIVFFASLLIQGCSFLKLTVSEKRNPEPYNLIINDDLQIASTGAINSSGVPFLPSSFKLIDNGVVSYFDPLVITDTMKADYIFISHAHPDHFSVKDIEKIMKKGTILICPKLVGKRLSKHGYKFIEVKPGDTLMFKDFLCQAVPAYNINSVFFWLKAHPKSNQNVGYVNTYSDGTRIYHAGDTDYIPEMFTLNDISVALVPIGGDNLTMNVKDAAEMINRIRPDIAVPMHYEPNKFEDLEKFKKLTEKNIQVKILN